jgi:hypothetical protein
VDANICIREIERIVDQGPTYVGPHTDPLAHVYGMASFLREMASTDDQKEKIAVAIAEFKEWFKQTRVKPAEASARTRENAMAALADLKRAYA